jgi:hypothetical protein
MHVTTGPEPGRGRAHARLLFSLARLEALDPGRATARERLEAELGPDLTRKLLFALAPGSVLRPCEAAPAAAA